jgi:hypothetical protein
MECPARAAGIQTGFLAGERIGATRRPGRGRGAGDSGRFGQEDRRKRMRRFVLLLGLLALVVALPATHTVFAKATKVDVCHVNSANQPGLYNYSYLYRYDYDEGYSYAWYEYHYDYHLTYHLGQVIQVSESAVDAHVAHGDSIEFFALTESAVDYITSLEDWNEFYEYTYEGSYYTYTYQRVRDNTNAVVKNADCYWSTYELDYGSDYELQ